MSGEPIITIVGRLTADPEPRISNAGKPWATMRVASQPRTFNKSTNSWEDGETMWIEARAFGRLSENLAASLRKGDPVILLGKLTQRSYTDRQGQNRTSLELEIANGGPDLTFATASVTKSSGNGGGPAGSGYAAPPATSQPSYGSTPGGGYAAPPQQQQGYAAPPAGSAGFDDEQPF